MIRQIPVNKSWHPMTKYIGYAGEHNATELIFSLPENFVADRYRMECITPLNVEYRSPHVDCIEGVIKYEVPQALLDDKGTLYCSVVGLSNNLDLICKGPLIPFIVGEAPTNANTEIPEEAKDAIEQAIQISEAAAASATADKLVVISERQLAEIARASAEQALSDLLRMLNTDIATLTGGKLTPSQIPAIAITNVEVLNSEEEMLAMIAEPGDIAIRLDNTTTYILQTNDPSVLEHWKPLAVPTNYADEAGHAATASEATNATMINNKRLISMTQAQYDVALLDPDTYYLVVPT